MELEKEFNLYRELKPSLIQDGHQGKFIVIKDNEVFDIFMTYEDALRQGLRRYGNVPFLLHQISRFERVHHFFHGVEVTGCQMSV